MATMHTFKVKKDKHGTSHEFTREVPTGVDETDLILDTFGSVERMIECAVRQFTVDIAPGIRERLPDLDAAKRYVAEYVDDGKKAPARVVRMDADKVKDLGFTEEQKAAMRAAGVKF